MFVLRANCFFKLFFHNGVRNVFCHEIQPDFSPLLLSKYHKTYAKLPWKYRQNFVASRSGFDVLLQCALSPLMSQFD